jgi:hypothetical protein
VKTKTWLILSILTILVASIVVTIVYYYALFIPRRPTVEGKDSFEIDEIYTTKEVGCEWYTDVENPFSDDLFSSTFERNISRQDWRIAGPAVRLNVGTSSNTVWKNVEINGYAKVIDPISSSSANDSRTDDSKNGEVEEKDFVSDVQHIQEQSILMVTLGGKKKYGILVDILMQGQSKRLRILL